MISIYCYSVKNSRFHKHTKWKKNCLFITFSGSSDAYLLRQNNSRLRKNWKKRELNAQKMFFWNFSQNKQKEKKRRRSSILFFVFFNASKIFNQRSSLTLCKGEQTDVKVHDLTVAQGIGYYRAHHFIKITNRFFFFTIIITIRFYVSVILLWRSLRKGKFKGN